MLRYIGGNMKNRVKEYRLNLGLTQQELAELVNVSSRTIISLEKEQYSPSLMLAYKLSLVFETIVEDLYRLKENYREELKNEK